MGHALERLTSGTGTLKPFEQYFARCGHGARRLLLLRRPLGDCPAGRHLPRLPGGDAARRGEVPLGRPPSVDPGERPRVPRRRRVPEAAHRLVQLLHDPHRAGGVPARGVAVAGRARSELALTRSSRGLGLAHGWPRERDERFTVLVLALATGAVAALVGRLVDARRPGRRASPRAGPWSWARPSAIAEKNPALARPWIAATGLAVLTMWMAIASTDVRYDFYRFVGGDARRRGDVAAALEAYTKADRYAPEGKSRRGRSRGSGASWGGHRERGRPARRERWRLVGGSGRWADARPLRRPA